MALPVSRPYACPICRESFTKWGLCQTHIRTSVPCRDALGDKMQDLDGLQDLCRNAAVAASTQNSVVNGGNVASASHPDAPGTLGTESPPVDAPSQQTSPYVVKKLKKAVKHGYLTEPEHYELECKFEELCEHSHAVQNATIDKFLGLGPGDLRWVVDKEKWLTACLRFCLRTNSHEPQNEYASPSPVSPSSLLMSALALHALLPDSLTQDCWDRFSELQPKEQTYVISAVRASMPTNVSGKFSDHFVNLCSNEKVIFHLEASPPARVRLAPTPLDWEAIDNTLYHRLLQHLLFKQRNCEERLFKELADADPDMQPGDPGSLLHTHKATEAARRKGSAEILALLHAGAASGLTRTCARFIAEGIDVNECTGVQSCTPLHVAAVHGEVGVLRLLLEQRADPNILDGDGHSALYVAVKTAIKSEADRGESITTVTPQSLQMKCCNALLHWGAESTLEGDWSPETLAEHHQIYTLRNLIRLHRRLQRLKQKNVVDEAITTELQGLQYETAMFAVCLFEKHLQKHCNSKSLAAEFRALIISDFIRERDKIQVLANKLAKRIGIRKKAVEALVNLPPEAAWHVLNNFRIQETVPDIFEVPDHLNPQDAQDAQQSKAVDMQISPERADGDGIHHNSEDASGTQIHQAGSSDAGCQSLPEPEEEPVKLEGRVRKWDPERGFGFIVQDPKEGEETSKDIFIHRTNVVGNSPSNPINLSEGCRISYRLGEHDGRLRALDATMIDKSSKPLPIHLGIRGKDRKSDGQDGSDNDMDDEDAITQKFIRYIRSKEVQELAKEKRSEQDSWLRCVGLKKHNNARRDDAVWKKEIDNRIDLLCDKNTTPLSKKDFDFRVRRFLNEFCVHSNVTRVSELLALVETSTAGKSRDDVRSWPAYLATLLRKFDPKLYEVLADRDRRSRIELRNQRRSEAAGAVDNAADHDALLDGVGEDVDQDIDVTIPVVETDPVIEDGDNSDNERDGTISPPADFSPRSSEVASTIHSSDSEEEQEPTITIQSSPLPPADVPDPTAGPGMNLFRYPRAPSEALPKNDADADCTGESRSVAETPPRCDLGDDDDAAQHDVGDGALHSRRTFQ